MRLCFVGLLLATAVVGAGCSQDRPAPGPRTDVDIQGRWRLTSAVIDGRAFDAPARADLTFVVSGADGQAHGGCAFVSLRPEVSGSSVTLGATEQDQMRGCVESSTAYDAPYLDAVSRVDHAARSHDALTLTGPGVSLDYTRVGRRDPAG